MLVLMITIVMLILFGVSYAEEDEQIPITYSGTRDRVLFDGKWSFDYEWKESSLNTYYYENDDKVVILRSAHQGNYVYLFIDAVNDESINDSLDEAVVCFDTNNDKNSVPDFDDFCFMATLGKENGTVFQGDPNEKNFGKIENPPDFIGLGGVSDKNDRYSGVPHTGYEFRIPTDTIGRKDIYGFYFTVYDKQLDRFYTYPTNATRNGIFSSPDSWGEIYSPDKSLPEFHLPALLILPSLALVIVMTRTILRKLAI